MHPILDILKVLQTGGLGLSAILLFINWMLLRYIREQHRERIEEQKASIELLEGVRNSLSGNEKALDRFSNKVDRLLTEWRP